MLQAKRQAACLHRQLHYSRFARQFCFFSRKSYTRTRLSRFRRP